MVTGTINLDLKLRMINSFGCTFHNTQSSQNGDLSLREVKIAFLIEASSEKIIQRQIRKSSIFLKNIARIANAVQVTL